MSGFCFYSGFQTLLFSGGQARECFARHGTFSSWNLSPGVCFPSQGPALQTEEQRHALSLLLEPRSLLVLQEDLYVRYLHGIRFVTEDSLTEKVANLAVCRSRVGETLRRGTRVSLTIRQVPKVLKTSIFLGRRK